jgi:serralysin
MPEVIQQHTDAPGCACTACSNLSIDVNDHVDASIDSQAGGTLNGKPILTAEQIAVHLNRTGGGYADGYNDTPVVGIQNNIGDDNTVITYGFFDTQSQLYTNGYVYSSGGRLFGLAEYFNFAPFSIAQRDAARESMEAWDDLVAVSFREVGADEADINFANLASAPTTQAYSRIPTAALDATLGGQVREIGGDIWVSASQASNFRLDEGQYGIHTLVHEIGHSLGLSHPGAYNAAPGLSITYPVNAEYAQDTRAYSVMSYFEGSAISGTRHFDFHISTTVYSATPLVHDILAIQRIYGADMTTRTGDTVYGFNSNAGRDSYDFTLTPAPIMAIWDAGGNDTIDASGYYTDQVIDLSPGSLSSIGGVTYDTAPTLAQVNANRAAQNLAPVAQATYNSNMALLQANPVVGRLTNNVGIAYGAVIENAIGGYGNDSLIGNSVANILSGNDGNDVIGGGAGDDTLNGGNGNDVLMGGLGADVLNGGEGFDLASYADSATGVNMTFRPTDGDVWLSIEGLEGSQFDDILTGGNGDDYLSGLGGADRLTGGNGRDTLLGGAGNDFLDGGNESDTLDGGAGDDELGGGNGDDSLEGGLGADTLIGGNGNDVLSGGADADTLLGGNGDDRLNGGAGNDMLVGGNGNDRFIFTDLGGNDWITDFRRGDKVDLSGLDAIGGGGDDAFAFIGSGAFTAAGQLRAYASGGSFFAEGDIDGDGLADFVIQTNVLLTASDFVL